MVTFNIRTQAGRIQGINHKYIRMVQRSDGECKWRDINSRN